MKSRPKSSFLVEGRRAFSQCSENLSILNCAGAPHSEFGKKPSELKLLMDSNLNSGKSHLASLSNGSSILTSAG